MKAWDHCTANDVLDLERLSPENFIDELKMYYLRSNLPEEGIIVEVGAGSGRFITRIGLEKR